MVVAVAYQGFLFFFGNLRHVSLGILQFIYVDVDVEFKTRLNVNVQNTEQNSTENFDFEAFEPLVISDFASVLIQGTKVWFYRGCTASHRPICASSYIEIMASGRLRSLPRLKK